MISIEELKNLCTERLKDARTLFEGNRYEGAYYLCGYVIEMGLKMRICKTLNWRGFPNTSKEFENLLSFKTHKLDVLLNLSGIKSEILEKYLSEWSTVNSWEPEVRYSPKKLEQEKVNLMLNSAETLLNNL